MKRKETVIWIVTVYNVKQVQYRGEVSEVMCKGRIDKWKKNERKKIEGLLNSFKYVLYN